MKNNEESSFISNNTNNLLENQKNKQLQKLALVTQDLQFKSREKANKTQFMTTKY